MMKKHQSNLSESFERRQFFGIRKLKNGIASVVLATALCFIGQPASTVRAEEAGAGPLETPVTVQDASPLSSDPETVVVEKVVAPSTAETAVLPENTEAGLATPDSPQAVTQDPSTTQASPTETDPAAPSQDLPVKAADGAAVDASAVLADLSVKSLTQSPEIAAGHVRLHFETPEEASLDQYGVWLWGGVEKPSDSQNWPHAATKFSAQQKDDYGYYLDVKQSENPAAIGYLLLKNGEKLTQTDQKIELLDRQMKEVWVAKDYQTYSYKPLADDSKLRINYKRQDNNYTDWGVWLWKDVVGTFDKWPQDAIDFTVTTDGAYVDVPLSKGKDSNLGFLLVNKKDDKAPGNKTIDLAFDNRQNHSQIFLREGDNKVYTNPFYHADQTEIDTSRAEPGKKNISVTATVNRAFHYNEAALLDLVIQNPNKDEVVKIEADTSAIGGKVLSISPELNRIALKATSAIAPGDYQIPIKVYDKDNGYYSTTATAKILERQKPAGAKDWDEQIIYFMVTDRFYNGDKGNDQAPQAGVKNPRGLYQGGDFRGVIEKLDYLQNLGVTSIWLTPIVENISQNAGNDKDGEYYGYHGYWASNFEKLNPHLGSLEDFHELIDKAAERSINIIVDVVLNHSGYGTEQTFNGLVRTKEENKEGDDQRGSLAGLPDFKTEDDRVRKQLVSWQTSWLDRSTTQKGNSIYAFRVDTVKHVDDTTWQAFKNALVEKDVDFHLIGESWGASHKDDKGDLGIGTMDSLLDFGFKDIAKMLIKGQLTAANKELIARNQTLTSSSTLGQFLGSHDEDGFAYSTKANEDQLKLAATMLLTAKGQPIIYYGEELGQSGANNWPIYDNRYDLNWDKVADSALLKHYQKVIRFRQENSELLSRGSNQTLAASDAQQWLLAQRSHGDQSAYILYSLNQGKKALQLEVSGADAVLKDHYSDQTFRPKQAADGKWLIELEMPSLAEGGTMLLKLDQGNILSAKQLQAKEDPIADGYFRFHFKKLPSDNLASLGLWLWEDVEQPSKNWPSGAISFSEAKQDDYGHYLDVKMIDGYRDKIGFLINDTAGKNITGDKQVDILSQAMNEAWLDDNYVIHHYRPQAEGTIRINYYRTDGNYDKKGLWVWGDIDESLHKMGTWPDGIDFVQTGKHGRYIDIKLKDLPKELGFLLVDETKKDDAAKIQPQDYKFYDLKRHSQLFLKDEDANIYTNPYYVNNVRMTGIQHISLKELEASFTTLEGATKEKLLKDLLVQNKENQKLAISEISLDEANKRVRIMGDFSQENAPYTVQYGSDRYTTRMSWQLKDALYKYDGELGARVKDKGQQVDMTLWSPSADQVDVVVYDKADQSKVLGKVAMTKGQSGEWHARLTAENDLSIKDYRGYYYHYEISRGAEKVLVLDPYAKSLAAWNSDLAETDPAYKIAKAAFVDPSEHGPKDLDYAKIDGFKAREDAVIYEAHVRDFTSDDSISSTLKAQFGTFAAFAERLDYLKELGVTHIQLLPVLSYYYVNELENAKRLSDYRSSDSNYNWGYDPQSYFALTGMYSENPSDPAKRIQEFKELVNAIHQHGMGVILDVVYNHTAKTNLFEDLEPNYYHFMNADGSPRTSFGGGRLGTTHYMSRRVLVDSIKYLTDEFKVDGFRFDMMGDHDAESIEIAFQEAKKLNPNVIMLGEGWRTYAGDENQAQKAADQDWMSLTDTVAVFSDDMRNSLKSGYPNEGQPAFITTGSSRIDHIFKNIKAQPTNFLADDPGDVIQYIAAHDNLTLFDIIAQSIKKDPSVAENNREIHRRLRLGNVLVLTSQGTPFLHSGQEYGRTKQFRHPDYKAPVSDDKVPNKSHLLRDSNGKPFDYPYFIHDSYDSSDAVNHFDWRKATDSQNHPDHARSQRFTKGLIELRRSTDAFSHKTKAEVEKQVTLITIPNQHGIREDDLVIGYQTVASNGDVYAVFVNADMQTRDIFLSDAYRPLKEAEILVDAEKAGIRAIAQPKGVALIGDSLRLDPLTATVLRLRKSPQQPAPTPNPQPQPNPDPTPNPQPNPVPPTQPGQDARRVLQDMATGVVVELGIGETAKAVGLRIVHIEPDAKTVPSILLGQDFDLYDIELVDEHGERVVITKPARVALPIDLGKAVAKVVYLPTADKAEDLAFVLSKQIIGGKEHQIILFTAEHFSYYGLVYAKDQARDWTVPTPQVPSLPKQTDQGSSLTETRDDKAATRGQVTPLALNRQDGQARQVLPMTGTKEADLFRMLGLVALASLGLLQTRTSKKEQD